MKRGFTLIETLVAVLILASALAGPLTIVSKALAAAGVAKNQTIAQYLAQDALEYVRFVRDSNRLAGAAWLNRLAPCVSADGSASCIVDSLADTVSACSGSCAVFVYQGGASSIFTRTVTIATPVGGSADEAVVRVVVTWKDNVGAGSGHSVTVIENLYNWQ